MKGRVSDLQFIESAATTGACVRALKKAYCRLSANPSQGGVNAGHGLRALLAHALWKVTDAYEWRGTLHSCLDDALVIEKASTSLYSGLPGIGWIIATLGKSADYPEAAATVRHIAQLLQTVLQRHRPGHDLVNGAAGVAVFARAAGPAGCKLVDVCWKRWRQSLGQHVETSNWTLDAQRPFDLGVAHGSTPPFQGES
ncbi:MAG: lanthionine synthetase LanC family protein [Betaproteobacteria bacterium]